YLIDASDPKHPLIAGELTNSFLKNPRCVAIQFRYGFITDDEGLKIVDLTEPTRPIPIPRGTIRLNHAERLYVARTYAYIANGPEGLAIVDIENPERPHLAQMFNAGGALNATRAGQIGRVTPSSFALRAEAGNGLRVVQLISPDTV